MNVQISAEEATKFTATLATAEYAAEERDYKVAVHEVLSRLLSPTALDEPEFLDRLAAFCERRLDLSQLDLDPDQVARIEAGVADSHGVTNAFIQLAGGRFGVNNFIWIPGAIRGGLGEQIRHAFQTLLDDAQPLAARVDGFRDQLYAAEQGAQAAGEFEPNWSLVPIALAFVAALLGAYDPEQYTFYAAGPLRQSYEELVGAWPRGSAGERYEVMCEFVQSVREELIRLGVPARDMIDAQSFIWLRRAGANGEGSTDLVVTSADAVRAAMAEFDRVGRDAFLEQYGYGKALTYFIREGGNSYDSKAIYGVAYGYEHPDHGPLSNHAFSGGDATVKRRLETLGFEVTGPDETAENSVWMVKAGRGDVHAPTVLQDGVISVEWGELDDLGHMTRDELASRMRTAFPERPQSTQTRDTNELYAFAHEIEAGDLIVLPQQEARFAVGRVTGGYEHRPDRQNGENHVHPVDWIRRDVPRTEVPDLNEAIGIRGFTVRKLPAGVAEAVRQFVEGGTTEPQGDPSSAIHLVVKWTPRYEPRTIELHQEVAEQHGAVWWALFSQAPQAKIAEESRNQLREQLEAGIPTYVFISGPTCWRTRLLALETDREAVDPDLIPSYYDRVPGREIVWLKISDFEPLEREELFRLLDPARKPGKPVALGNQANPLFVRIRTKPRFWWVNQGESYQRARSGAFLWAPILDKAGRTKSHWLTMRHLRPGDYVFSYANSQVRALNEVVAAAVPAPRPDPQADQAWNEEGNRAELRWDDLEPPILLRDIPVDWRTREGGPFAGDGSVNQGYLFPLSDEFVARMVEQFPQISVDVSSPPPPELPIADDDYLEPPLPDIAAALAGAGMTIDERTLRRYHLSLKTRGFVVLSGISGTGKTWLAEEYAKAVGARPLVVPVAPNWTTNEDLLGYLNPLTQQYHDTEFSGFLREAATTFAAATAAGRQPRPYHLVLDEMNLARVEYYFAKFLSAMELRARSEDAFIELAPNDQVPLPPNLKFIGTVNVDETTHGFADKVYDRSQLLELTIDEDEVSQHLGDREFAPVLVEVWLVMREVAPFAFRVLDEITAYVAEASQEDVPWEEALDEQLLQKVLPKVRGTDLRVGGALRGFVDLSTDRFPLSYEKAVQMLRAFDEHGFTSYF
jgi:hypothetical protein